VSLQRFVDAQGKILAQSLLQQPEDLERALQNGEIEGVDPKIFLETLLSGAAN
jgi:hypothetical protein